MLVTEAEAREILEALRKAGIKAKIVGGVSEKGSSEHDLDLAVPIKSRFLYSRYVHAMKSLGFIRVAGVHDHMEHNLETWQRGDLVIDVWMEE